MRYQLLGVVICVVLVPAISHADLKCGGVEPSWSLTIGAKTAMYDDLDGKKVMFNIVTAQDARGIKPGHVRKYVFKNAQSTADAVVLKKKCDDGMSDETYPYNITLTIMKTVFSGCCQ